MKPRLVLSLINEPLQQPHCDASHGLCDRTLLAPSSEQEALQLLLDKHATVLSAGQRLPVNFQVATGGTGSLAANLSALSLAAKLHTKPEHVWALLKVTCTEEDLLHVSALLVTSSAQQFKKGSRARAAVMRGSLLSLSIAVPSLIQADPDLILSFAENLVKTLRIEHDCKTGDNLLITGS
jgi:hypothetical protein